VAKGKIVAWYQGRNEFGPRALGNRSILADPRDPKSAIKLNNSIKNRESFMPFAPSVLMENSTDYFESFGTESPYMILSFNVRKEKRNIIPAILSIDGTARIQTVNKNDNHKY
jgi:carbamoyltransferase